jgi:hypothetical protein
MATGRDAADVAITTSFGNAILTNFYVDSYEVLENGTKVPPLPGIATETSTLTAINGIVSTTAQSSPPQAYRKLLTTHVETGRRGLPSKNFGAIG